jgi:hypothetical protein
MTETQNDKQLSSSEKSFSITNISKFYMQELDKTISEYSMKLDEEQINCAQSMLATMVSLCQKEAIKLSEIDQSNIMMLLKQCVMLRLNFSSVPSECYMIIRNQKDKKDNWTKVFEFGVQGDGNDKIVRTYGVGVKKIYPYWIVREGDDFTYPVFKGLTMEPPTWGSKGGCGKYIRIVYPIEYEDGMVQYHIAERADVAVNLKAHILNNIKMKKDMDYAKKQAIQNKIKDMTLDQMFEDSECLNIMSPAWREPQSREAMILRKMRNNALKPIPREFKNVYAAQAYEDTVEDKVEQEKPDPESVIDVEVNDNSGKEEIKELPKEESSSSVDSVTGEVKEHKANKKRPF